MESMWWYLGIAGGFICGMQYIPHQLKKRNPKIIKQVKDLLEAIGEPPKSDK